MKTPPIIKAAQVGIVVLSLGSYALSFDRLYLASISAGTPWQLAVVYGLLLEGFVSLATFTAYVARGSRQAIYPWVVAAMAFAFSFVANYDTTLIPVGLIRSLPVVLLPVGVHLLIVLTSAHKAREAVETATVVEPTIVEVPVEVEVIREVPMAITPETVDIENVENPYAVAYRLLEQHHEKAGNVRQIGYARKKWQAAMGTAAA